MDKVLGNKIFNIIYDEIYAKGEKQMTPKEVLQALIDGKKVRKTYWYSSNYIYLEDGIIFNHHGIEDKIEFNHIFIDQWELYQEPKKTKRVTYYKYYYSYFNSLNPDRYINACAWTTKTADKVLNKDEILVETEERIFEVPCE